MAKTRSGSVPGLYQKPNGYWFVDVVVKGVRKQQATGTKVLAEAMDVLAQVRQGVREAVSNPLEQLASISLQEAIVRVLDEEYGHLTPPRYREQEQKLLFWQAILGKKTLLHHIDERAIDLGLSKLRQRGLTGSTKNRYRSAISKVMTWARKKRFLVQKLDFDYDGENQGRIVFMTEEMEREALAFLAQGTFPGARHLADIIVVGIDTGLRRGELVAITYQRHIKLSPEVPQPHIYLTSDVTKSGRERIVPLTTRAQEVLARRREDGYKPFMYAADTVSHWFADLKAGLKIEDEYYGIHMLRHTYCTRLVWGGMDIKAIKDLAGHESISTTQRYLQMSPQRLTAALDVLERDRQKVTPTGATEGTFEGKTFSAQLQ